MIAMSMIFSALSISIPRDKNYTECNATFRGARSAQRAIAASDADPHRPDRGPFAADPQRELKR